MTSRMANRCSRFDALLDYRGFSSRSHNLSNRDRASLGSVPSTYIPSSPTSTSKHIRGIPLFKLKIISMIRLATTGGRYLSSFEPHALSGRFAAIAAASLLPCLCLNIPVLFYRSSCKISLDVSIKIWDERTFSLEITYQSLLPLLRSFTLNIAPLVSLLIEENNVITNNVPRSGFSERF